MCVNAESKTPQQHLATPLPPSSVLDRVKAFLPSMQQANEQLAQALATQPETLDIENVDEGTPHIEMDLACGVLELKDSSAVSAAEKAMQDGQPADGCQPISRSSDDEEEDSNDDEDEPTGLDSKTAPEASGQSGGEQQGGKETGKKGQRRRAGIVELDAEKGSAQDRCEDG